MLPLITPIAFSAEGEHFCGIALDQRWCLTVAHPSGLNETCQVRFYRQGGLSGPVAVETIIRHESLDLALVRLQTDAPIRVIRPLFRHDADVGMGKEVVLHVSHPTSPEKLERFTNYSLGSSSSTDLEYRLGPENSMGHSGGVVTLDQVVIGILFERELSDPHCYAVPVAAAKLWIEDLCPGIVEWTHGGPDEVIGDFLDQFQKLAERASWLKALKPAVNPGGLRRSNALELLTDFARNLAEWVDFPPKGFHRNEAVRTLQRLLENYIRLAVRESAVAALLGDGLVVTVLPATDSGLAGIAYAFGGVDEWPKGTLPRLTLKRTEDGWVKPMGVVAPSLATQGIGTPQKHDIQREFWNQCVGLGAFPMDDGQELTAEDRARLRAQLMVQREVHRQITVIACCGSANDTLRTTASELDVRVLPYSGEPGSLFYCSEDSLRALVLDCLQSIDALALN